MGCRRVGTARGCPTCARMRRTARTTVSPAHEIDPSTVKSPGEKITGSSWSSRYVGRNATAITANTANVATTNRFDLRRSVTPKNVAERTTIPDSINDMTSQRRRSATSLGSALAMALAAVKRISATGMPTSGEGVRLSGDFGWIRTAGCYHGQCHRFRGSLRVCRRVAGCAGGLGVVCLAWNWVRTISSPANPGNRVVCGTRRGVGTRCGHARAWALGGWSVVGAGGLRPGLPGRVGCRKARKPAREVERGKCNFGCELHHIGNDFDVKPVEPDRKLKRPRLN